MSIIYTWHETCVPCKTVGPIFEKLEDEFAELKFAKLNVRDYPELQNKYHVLGVPSFLVFSEGEYMGRIMWQSEHEIRASFKRVIANNGKLTKMDVPEAFRHLNLFDNNNNNNNS